MTPAPNPLPEELAEHAFPSSRAAKLGVTPKMLRGRRYTQLHHGVHAFAHRENGREGFAEKVMLRVARDYLPLLRDGEAFSHTSALLLYEAPIWA